ncbi:MAG TPA: 2-dehydro-3-deoxygalactonokinase [Brevundimonas sp.]
MSSTASGDTALIGVDWGTSNLRVMRIDASGAVLESRSDPRGAASLTPDQFPDVLAAVAGAWIEQEAPVIVCGMAGARGRWLETAYAPCPASLADLGAALVRPEGARNVAIIPGVAVFDEGGLSDVMRGEETQAMGLFGPGEDGLVLAPGTHSKWIKIEDGRIAAFRTFVTGELFAAIKGATVIGAGLGDAGRDEAAFLEGVRRSLADHALTAALFSVRVQRLSGRLSDGEAADYLSGLLIGAEIAAQSSLARDARVVIVGAPALAERYRLAMDAGGFTRIVVADGQAATATGLWRIWSAAQ